MFATQRSWLASRVPRRPGYPGPHPEPPDEIDKLELPITLIRADKAWFRLHRADRSPLFFGRTGANRFDAPDGEFGVLYLGDSLHCCFVETYGRSDRGDHRIVTRRELIERNFSEVEFTRSLRIVDLAGAGLARLGADNRLATSDYFIAQRWSHALWSHPDLPDGLLYRSRHDPSRRCLALFDRVSEIPSARDIGSLVDGSNVVLLADILDTYDIGYLD